MKHEKKAALLEDAKVSVTFRAEFFPLDGPIDGPIDSLSQVDFSAVPDHTDTLDTLALNLDQADGFATSISGDIQIDTAGLYTFYLTSEGGSSLSIGNDTLIGGDDGMQTSGTQSVTVELAPGLAALTVLSFDTDGAHSLSLDWSGPDTSNARTALGAEATPSVGTASAEQAAVMTDMAHDETMPGMTQDETMPGMTHDHAEATIMPPMQGATTAEIDAYVDAVKAQPEAHVHADDSGKLSEHTAAMELVARDEATHVAVSDGDWFDASTWHNGIIPGDGAKVLIPEGIQVDYGSVSDARLFTVRVDGTLNFATDADSRMVFDTTVVSPTGSLIVGTVDNPVSADVSVELIVANNGPIDTDWDPMLLSRGIVAHGSASIHGAEKDSHEKVTVDPMAGDKALVFDTLPDGWKVGDQIVIAGTEYDGHKWDDDLGAARAYPSEDEVRTIKAIDGNKVILNKALQHDHDTPRDDLKTSVANMTRNVLIETENGNKAEVYERGHVMFMHSDDVDVRYAEFKDLGRTDKSVDSFDISDFEETQYDSNVQGRYSLHLHKTGTTDADNPVQVIGNAVWGSPGWGFVQHDSNADFDNNASFDTFGAGYVAETGNETGTWNDNIAIYAEGVHWGIAKNTSTVTNTAFDTARGGEGFWFQGRLITATDNVAASVNSGFVYFHRDGDDRMIPVDAENFEFSDALLYQDQVIADHVSIIGFSGNETFASNRGLEIVKANPNQGHDVWSQLDSLTAWNVNTGAHLEYTSHYILRDFDLISKEEGQYSPLGNGIELGKNTSEVVIINANIDGFGTGIELFKLWTAPIATEDMHDYVVIDANITNTATEYGNLDPAIDHILDSADLPNLAPDLKLDLLRYEGGKVLISGTKSDTLGETRFPGGIDTIQMLEPQVANALETGGYWKTTSGLTYFLINIYFTDRVTGEVFYETHPVFLDETTTKQLGWEWWAFGGAVDNGVQDFETISGHLYAGDHVLDSAIVADVDSPAPAPEPETPAPAPEPETPAPAPEPETPTPEPTSGDDVLTGSETADVIRGHRGDDEISGGDSNDKLFGNRGSDTLKGGDGNDKLVGGKHADVLLGQNGDDRLFGNRGHDTLSGGNGNDMLSGGRGKDTLTGGKGENIFHFEQRHGRDTITDFTIGEDHIRIDLEGVSYEDLVMRNTDAGAKIFTGDGSIVLLGVDLADLSESDFMFTDPVDPILPDIIEILI